MKRTALSPGRRKVRPKVPDKVRAEVKQRTDGLCHLCLWRLGYAIPVTGAAATAAVRRIRERRGVRRVVHLHHVYSVQRWPGLAKVPANLIGLCWDCHMGHEFPGCKPTRIPRAALPAEAIALAAGNGPMLNHLERIYPLTAAGRTPATT